jgi:hypothetical protein
MARAPENPDRNFSADGDAEDNFESLRRMLDRSEPALPFNEAAKVRLAKSSAALFSRRGTTSSKADINRPLMRRGDACRPSAHAAQFLAPAQHDHAPLDPDPIRTKLDEVARIHLAAIGIVERT